MEPNPKESVAYQATAESLQSTFHEQVVEHIFIAELLQEAGLRYNTVVEVMRSEVDAYGYDLVLECQGVVRHVQLKTSRHDAQTSSQKVSVALATKPSGCVVWIKRTKDKTSFRFNLSYLFFGNEPGKPLSKLLEKGADEQERFAIARHTKRDGHQVRGLRPGLRVVPKSAFQAHEKNSDLNITQLFALLFIS